MITLSCLAGIKNRLLQCVTVFQLCHTTLFIKQHCGNFEIQFGHSLTVEIIYTDLTIRPLKQITLYIAILGKTSLYLGNDLEVTCHYFFSMFGFSLNHLPAVATMFSALNNYYRNNEKY